MVADPVQAALLDIIAAKKKGAKKAKAKPKAELEAPSNVINIMDALRRSWPARSKPEAPPLNRAAPVSPLRVGLALLCALPRSARRRRGNPPTDRLTEARRAGALRVVK